MRKRPDPMPHMPGDKIILRKHERQTEIEVRRHTQTANGVRYKCNGKFYDTLREALLALFSNGWSGSSIITDRKPRPNNNTK